MICGDSTSPGRRLPAASTRRFLCRPCTCPFQTAGASCATNLFAIGEKSKVEPSVGVAWMVRTAGDGFFSGPGNVVEIGRVSQSGNFPAENGQLGQKALLLRGVIRDYCFGRKRPVFRGKIGHSRGTFEMCVSMATRRAQSRAVHVTIASKSCPWRAGARPFCARCTPV